MVAPQKQPRVLTINKVIQRITDQLNEIGWAEPDGQERLAKLYNELHRDRIRTIGRGQFVPVDAEDLD